MLAENLVDVNKPVEKQSPEHHNSQYKAVDEHIVDKSSEANPGG